jgi:CBS domain containing-hemolysin-like protein
MINGVLTLAQRSLRSIMTPRGEISWVDAEQSEDEIRRQLLSSPHSLFPVCRGELDEIIGIVRAKEMLVALESGKTSRRWPRLPGDCGSGNAGSDQSARRAAPRARQLSSS